MRGEEALEEAHPWDDNRERLVFAEKDVGLGRRGRTQAGTECAVGVVRWRGGLLKGERGI